MNKEKFLIVGNGGRESAFAKNLSKDTELYAVMGHDNPTIVESVLQSGGNYLISDPSNPEEVSKYAQEHNIDYAFVSADGPLACGVVDALLRCNIKAVGGTQEATRIEWDKVYSIDLVHRVCPEFTPMYKIVDSVEDLSPALEDFKSHSMEVVVKPQGLTGGKGVKVMPEHLPSYEAAADYAEELLNKHPEEKILLVEKLQGIEFTIMGLTDGEHMVLSPASYDYPFRLENDLGAGTGGMGCFTDSHKKLPFMTEKDLSDCQYVMQSVIDEMREKDLFFNGVLNGGFFVTKDGIKFMEFNGRFGDPEGLNILSVLQSPFSQLIRDMWHKTLSEQRVAFVKRASVVKYLVAREYPEASKEVIRFSLDKEKIEELGLDVFFCFSDKKRQATL
jgi:phosphoribosylamine--glycine ligase